MLYINHSFHVQCIFNLVPSFSLVGSSLVIFIQCHLFFLSQWIFWASQALESLLVFYLLNYQPVLPHQTDLLRPTCFLLTSSGNHVRCCREIHSRIWTWPKCSHFYLGRPLPLDTAWLLWNALPTGRLISIFVTRPNCVMLCFSFNLFLLFLQWIYGRVSTCSLKLFL